MIEVRQVPRPELVVIGDDAELAARFEAAPDVEEGLVLDHALFVVLLLRPGVGEVEVHDIDDRIGDAPLQELGRVRMQDADIGVRVLVFAPTADAVGDVGCELAYTGRRLPAQKAKEIGLLDEERALARADLEFEAPIGVLEPVAQVETPRFGVVDDGVGEFREFIARDPDDAQRRVERFAVSESE